MSLKILNVHKCTEAELDNGVYVGRGSIYGNPFRIGRDGSRKECIQKYKEKILGDAAFLTFIKMNLRGKDLICFCAPLPCHAEVLAEIANS
jgi:hypothetical protein